MRKLTIVVVLALLLVLGVLPAVAQTTHTGHTMMIGGLVPLILDLTITPDTQAQDLPLLVTGPDVLNFEQRIAEIDILTNNSSGWELWVYSENGSQLENKDGDAIAYTVNSSVDEESIGDVSIDPAGSGSGGDGDGALGGTGRIVAKGAGLGATGDLNVKFTQSAGHPAGYYSDIISVVLRAQ